LKSNNEKRIFIGIAVNRKIKSILTILKSTVNCNHSQIKWMPIANIHLTLSFIGNVKNKDIPHLIKSFEKKILSNNFKITIEGTGVFPSFKSPKVLWLGIGKGLDELTSIQYKVEKSIRKFKENPQKTTYTPHITIARIQKLHGKIDVLPFLNTVYSPIELDINSICLYESILLPEGAQYMVLTEFPLN